MTDYEITKEANIKNIEEVGASIGISKEQLYHYGSYIAKFQPTEDLNLGKSLGKLIFVTAITATPLGEGKTTITIGLSDALWNLGYKSIAVIREPSLGPVFGIKGGATGGGLAQAIPMEDINTHFTGDIPAVEAAHNLLQTLVDNSIFHGNHLNIDPRRVVMRRVMDANDRALRNIVIGLGGTSNGVPRETGFDITASSEVMAILALSRGMSDLKERLGKIVVAYTSDGKVVEASDLSAVGGMALLLRNAIKPNLVQSIENRPIFVHGGPFANVAHGSASIIAIKSALNLSDFSVVEGGFATDLGGEKFMDIVSRIGNLRPSAVVIVASIRALKWHGGSDVESLTIENVDALKNGLPNLEKHIENMKFFGVPVIVCLNRFKTDTDKEISFVKELVESKGVRFAISNVWAEGGKGGLDLAKSVIDASNEENSFHFLYEPEETVESKIERIAKTMYGATSIEYTKEAIRDLKLINKNGFQNLLVCMAKTQLSLSDDPKKLGRPREFTVTIREIKVSNGAGFVVPIAGDIMTMPGLPKVPAAENIDITKDGDIVGLF
jgi:formate--tetrahydrofolate ligase